MPIEFACEACKKLLRVPDGSGGLSCECPSCRTLLEIPDPQAIKVVESANPTRDAGKSNKLSIACPKCCQELVCAADLLGSRGQCKKCNYIFRISTERQPAAAEQPTGLVFRCPKCEQLFEGQEEMRGRKGKCHACGEVFLIELRPAEAARSEQTIQKTIRRTPSQAPTKRPKSTQSAEPSTAATAIQLECTNCQGVMEVPASAAGQTTACPYCQQLLHIPSSEKFRAAPRSSGSGSAATTTHQSSSFPNAAPAASGNGQSDWIDLGDFSGAANPYGTIQTDYHPPPVGPIYTSAPQKTRRTPVVYVLPGIFMLLMGIGVLLLIAYQIYNFVNSSGDLQRLQPEAKVMLYVFMGGGLLLGGLQAILQIAGGVALIRRAGLSTARTGAIASCLPCIWCLGVNLPFGIWATIVCFSGTVKRDFDY